MKVKYKYTLLFKSGISKQFMRKFEKQHSLELNAVFMNAFQNNEGGCVTIEEPEEKEKKLSVSMI